MLPFKAPDSLRNLAWAYPAPRDVIAAVAVGQTQCAREIAALWMSEGVPWAFQQHPAMFATVRGWIADQVGVESKDVTIVGSARFGGSLAPRRVGQPFGQESDLDVAIVSETLFAGCREAFQRWSDDYRSERITPSSAERGFWDDNIGTVANTLRRGFVDTWKIPLRAQYRESQLVADAMSRLTRKLTVTADAPHVRKSTARIYRDWESFVRQVALNLLSVADQGA